MKHLAYLQAQHRCVAGSAHKGRCWAGQLRAGLHLCLCLCLCLWGWLWRPIFAAGGLCRDGHMLALGSHLRARRGLQAVQNSISAQTSSCTGLCRPCWGVSMLQAKPVRLVHQRWSCTCQVSKGESESSRHGHDVTLVCWHAAMGAHRATSRRQPSWGLSQGSMMASAASTVPCIVAEAPCRVAEAPCRGLFGASWTCAGIAWRRCRCSSKPPDGSPAGCLRCA